MANIDVGFFDKPPAAEKDAPYRRLFDDKNDHGAFSFEDGKSITVEAIEGKTPPPISAEDEDLIILTTPKNPTPEQVAAAEAKKVHASWKLNSDASIDIIYVSPNKDITKTDHISRTDGAIFVTTKETTITADPDNKSPPLVSNVTIDKQFGNDGLLLQEVRDGHDNGPHTADSKSTAIYSNGYFTSLNSYTHWSDRNSSGTSTKKIMFDKNDNGGMTLYEETKQITEGTAIVETSTNRTIRNPDGLTYTQKSFSELKPTELQPHPAFATFDATVTYARKDSQNKPGEVITEGTRTIIGMDGSKQEDVYTIDDKGEGHWRKPKDRAAIGNPGNTVVGHASDTLFHGDVATLRPYRANFSLLGNTPVLDKISGLNKNQSPEAKTHTSPSMTDNKPLAIPRPA